MIDLDKLVAWLVLVVGVLCVMFAALVLRDVHTLTSTNAQLVDLLDTQLTATQARMSVLEDLQRESVQLLIDAGPAAYVELLQRETEK